MNAKGSSNTQDFDPDTAPDVSKDGWPEKFAKTAVRRGRPPRARPKVSTPIRLSQDVIDHFRAGGRKNHMTQVTTYYLEMRSPSWLRSGKDPGGLRVYECEIKTYQLNRFLYQYVGEPWEWTDKLSWSDEQWKTYAESDTLRTWVAHYRGSPAGYYELRQEGGDVEIAYFGLAPGFIGQGFGGYLLSHAIESAWAWKGTTRVWVHTCTLDHPNALPNYRARGLRVFRTETC